MRPGLAILRIVCLTVFISNLCALAEAADDDDQKAVAFELESATGEPIVLSQDSPSKLTVVCFLGIECPLAKLYAPRLEALSQRFEGQGVRFVGLNSNRQDSLEELKEFAIQHSVTFPVGKDDDNVIADKFLVKRTPEVIVVDRDMSIRYRGRVDDQYAPGVGRNQPDREDLRIAIQQVLAGEVVDVAKTQAQGCLLGRVTKPAEDATVTFASQVSRVLQNHCAECHHAGDIGPFSLTDYDEVVGWGDMMVEVIDNGRMPPWHADPQHGSFSNARLMPAKEKQVIRDWVAQGMPLGDRKQLPTVKEFSTGWQLPKQPDQVITMRERPFKVPADGTVEYQYFVVDPKFEEDVWVAAAEVVPGNRSVVHHSIVFIRPPDGERFRGIGWLGAYVPGQRLPDFQPNQARRIPAGSKLVFQQHYTPNGTEQTDITKVGLVFVDEAQIEHELLTFAAMNQGFEIFPNKSNQKVTANLKRLPKMGMLLGISPHMHFRGDQFVAVSHSKGQRTTLLKVPSYDFNWQHSYQFSDPIPLEGVTNVQSEFVFDNSDKNPFNPDPASYVTWGDQTWEEMAVAFFEVSVPREVPDQVESPQDSSAKDEEVALVDQKLHRHVQQFFDRFDSDGDGRVVADELPLAVRIKGFKRFDKNGDKAVTQEELSEYLHAKSN